MTILINPTILPIAKPVKKVFQWEAVILMTSPSMISTSVFFPFGEVGLVVMSFLDNLIFPDYTKDKHLQPWRYLLSK